MKPHKQRKETLNLLEYLETHNILLKLKLRNNIYNLFLGR